MLEKKWQIAIAAVSIVVFLGINTGANVKVFTVEAYPFYTCASSGGPVGYVEKVVADKFVPLSNLGILVDTSTHPITYTCITIDRNVVEINSEELDERSLASSNKTNCPDCIEEWE